MKWIRRFFDWLFRYELPEPEEEDNEDWSLPEMFQNIQIDPSPCQTKRFFGANDAVLYLCERCHAEVERVIPLRQKLSVKEYFELHEEWLKGGSNGKSKVSLVSV